MLPTALLACCPGWVAQEWGQKCSGGLITPPAPWIRQCPVGPGGMRLERQTYSALTPGCAHDWPTPFLCWDHSGGGTVPKPAAPFSCWLWGCCPTPSTGNGPALFPQRKQSHPGSVTWEHAARASNLLLCPITLFPGPARISCPALQHQTGPARYGATFLLVPNIASSTLVTLEVGAGAAFAGSSSPARWGGIHGEASMHTWASFSLQIKLCPGWSSQTGFRGGRGGSRHLS